MSTEELLEKIKVKKDQYTQFFTDLQGLLQRMQSHPDAFDEEDQQLVHYWIVHYDHEIQALEKEWSVKQHLYQGTVRRMEEALETRMAVLQEIDDQTRVLENHPELMNQLVEKQATLTELLQAMKDKLTEPATAVDQSEYESEEQQS